jgi:guanylate kinase
MYLYCLIGASGSGKSTIAKEVDIPELVSTTTRAKRDGEIEGVHYKFIEKESFNKNDYVEYTEYNGNYYGLSKADIENALDKGDHLVVVDKHGYDLLRYKYGNRVIGVYVKSYPLDNILRMIARGDKLKEVISRALHSLKKKEYSNAKYLQYEIDNTYSIEFAKVQLLNIIDAKRIYLSGTITIEKSLEDARIKFAYWERELKKLGFKVINPFNISPKIKDWVGYMKEDLDYLMRYAEGIVFIDNHIENSRGCMIEKKISEILQIPIYEFQEKDEVYSGR